MSSEWKEWRPRFNGDCPTELAGVRLIDVEFQFWSAAGPGWVDTPAPVWCVVDLYRYRLEDSPGIGHNGGPPPDQWDSPTPVFPPPARQVSLPEDPKRRAEYPLFDGFLAYFPNAAAEVSRLSYLATQQHHPDQPMHWDRSKSTDHLNKIARHMIDAGKVDDHGVRHSVMLAWRAMANLQEELERDEGLPPSPASRNRPF